MADHELAASTVVRHPDSGEVVILTVGSPLPAWAEGVVDEYLLAPVGTAAAAAEDARQAAVAARRQRRIEAQARAAAEESAQDDLVEVADPGDFGSEAGSVGTDPDAGSSSSSSSEGLTEPPRAGRGSGLDAWVAYAEARGIEVPDGTQRDDVIALVDNRAGD